MMKRRAGARRSGSVPPRAPGRNFLCGRSLYQPPPFFRALAPYTSASRFCETKKAPHMGGTVLTPAEVKFRGGGAAPLLV